MKSASTIHPRSLKTAGFGVALLALATLAACSDSSSPPKDVTPATITASTTDTLRAAAGAAINSALTVTVANKAGVPIDSAAVTFAVTAGGGHVSTTNAVANSAGQATTTWTLGTGAGVQTMTATSGTVSATFTALASATAPSTVTKVAGDAQTAAGGVNVAIAPSVKVTDSFGNPVAGVLVTFSVAAGGGSVTGSLVNTDVTGVATVGSWKLGLVAGPNNLTATATGLSAVTFGATASAGAVTQLSFTNTAPALATGQTFTLTAQAKDANNNIVSAAPITFASLNPAVATIGASTGVVTAVGSGTALITATSGTVTAQQVVSVTGHPSTTLVGTVAMTTLVGGIAMAGTTAFVARSAAGTVAVVDLPTTTQTGNVDLSAYVVDVAANSAGTVVAAATSSPSRVYFINPSTATKIDSLNLPANPTRMAMTSNGAKLYVDLDNFSVAVIDVASRTITATMSVVGTATAMKMAVGDTLVYIGTKLGTVYELATGTNTVRRQFAPSTTVADIAIAPDGKTLYVADGSRTINVVPLATGGMASQTYDFSGSVMALGIPRDGTQLWAGYLNGGAIVPIVNATFGVWAPVAITGAQTTDIVFNNIGSFVVFVDASVNQIIILK